MFFHLKNTTLTSPAKYPLAKYITGAQERG